MKLKPALLFAGLFAAGAATACVVVPRATSIRDQSRARAESSSPGPGQQPAKDFSPQQLDNLVAPIALYPDSLPGQVLV